jgi:hypothetical protein
MLSKIIRTSVRVAAPRRTITVPRAAFTTGTAFIFASPQ